MRVCALGCTCALYPRSGGHLGLMSRRSFLQSVFGSQLLPVLFFCRGGQNWVQDLICSGSVFDNFLDPNFIGLGLLLGPVSGSFWDQFLLRPRPENVDFLFIFTAFHGPGPPRWGPKGVPKVAPLSALFLACSGIRLKAPNRL